MVCYGIFWSGQLYCFSFYDASENVMGVVCRVVKSSRLMAKITAYFVSISRLLCLAFLYAFLYALPFNGTIRLLSVYHPFKTEHQSV